MAINGNAHGLGTVRAKDIEAKSSITRGASEEVKLAEEFLGTLANPRASWAALFETWADERGLDEAMARTVKVTVLRLRTFGAIARHQPRRRR